MLKMIFNQLWNQRRQNGWIFMELLVVSFFLWTVIDPIYVLTANRHIDSGYRPEGLYVVQMGAYNESNALYNKEQDNDSLSKAAYWRIVRLLRQQPEVKSYSISYTWAFPNSRSWSGTQIYADTASISREDGYVHAQRYDFAAVEGSNLFAAYGMTDVRTGGELKLPEDVRHRAFISERLARRLFGTIDVVGRKVYEYNKEDVEVAGVFRDYKHRDYEQPYPLIVYMDTDIYGSKYMAWDYGLIIRLKDGVDADAFERRFKKEVGPMLSIGNFYFDKLQTFSELSDTYAAQSGMTNKLRLQYALASFAVLCIFLGMVGTFWIRCNARRQEIGLMASMGAGRKTICRQFLVEAWMLVTVTFAVMLPLLLHHAWVNGVYVMEMEDYFVPNPDYWQNRFGMHFLLVTVLSYSLLLVVALIGTYIPAYRAARTLPAEALRDE